MKSVSFAEWKKELDWHDSELYNSRRVNRANIPTVWFQSDLSESDTKGQNCGIKVGYHKKKNSEHQGSEHNDCTAYRKVGAWRICKWCTVVGHRKVCCTVHSDNILLHIIICWLGSYTDLPWNTVITDGIRCLTQTHNSEFLFLLSFCCLDSHHLWRYHAAPSL